MKRLILIGAVLVMAVGFTTAQKTDTRTTKKTIKQVEVNRVRGKNYTMDLSKAGTIYSLTADVDRSQIKVHTSKGDMTVAELIQKSGKNVTGAIRVGMTSDMRAQRFGSRIGPGRLNYSCGDLACACTGDDDCNDLFTSDKCGPIAVCYPDGCICIRI